MKANDSKTNMNPTNIRKLQARVKELEQTLNSIHSGGVDALIVKNKKGEMSVFTLEGDDEPYRLLVESFSVGAITTSDDGIIVHCNKSFADMIKKSKNDIIGTSFYNYVGTNQQDKLKKFLTQAKETLIKGEFALKNTSDKSAKEVLLTCQPLTFGNVEGLSIVVTDISEMKAMQQEIFKAKEYYRTIMDNATCAIYVHDAEGTILEVNKEMENILGDSRDFLIGKNIKEYCLPQEQHYAVAQLQKLSIEKHIGPAEGHLRDIKTGKVKNVDLSGTSIGADDDNLYISIINEITEKKQLQAAALLTDKLTTLGVLAAGIIHEINNPVTWILSNLNYLKKKMDELSLEDPSEAAQLTKFKEIIDETLTGTEKIREIVKNLKSFARTDDKKAVEPVNIHDVLNAAIDMASPELKNVARLKTNFSQNIPKVLASPGKLQQVFLNLIVNATQAFPAKNDKNIITISTAKIKNTIQINIKDTGAGISEQTLPHIFEPFFTTKPSGIGTGIGLSICADIINQAGGEITVTSTLGQGTNFSVNLPLEVALKMTANQKTSNAKISQKCILLVTEKPAILNKAKEILESKYIVRAVLGGRAALNVLERENIAFDAVVTQLMMADVNGADLYRYIKKRYPGKENSILFISKDKPSLMLDEFINSIDNVCLKIPFSDVELLRRIKDLLQDD